MKKESFNFEKVSKAQKKRFHRRIYLSANDKTFWKLVIDEADKCIKNDGDPEVSN